MPRVAVVVEVVHGGLERGLERMRIILKQPQHDSPNQRGEQRERVFFGLRDQTFLHRQPRQSKEDSGQQVHVYLAVDVVILPKHQPSSNTGGQKGVRLYLFALQLLLKSLQAFICEDEAGQVPGVSVCGLSDRPKLLSQTATSEEKRHHKGVRGTDFSTIYSSIPEAFEHRQRSFVFVLLQEVVDCV